MQWNYFILALLITFGCGSKSNQKAPNTPNSPTIPEQGSKLNDLKTAIKNTKIASIYLTWEQEDTSTTMVVHYISKEKVSTKKEKVKGEGMTFYSPEEVIIANNEGVLDIHAKIKVKKEDLVFGLIDEAVIQLS